MKQRSQWMRTKERKKEIHYYINSLIWYLVRKENTLIDLLHRRCRRRFRSWCFLGLVGRRALFFLIDIKTE